MPLQAFIDDSGHAGHSPVFVLAGYVASAERWAAFSQEWQRILDIRPPLCYFKMNEAATLRDQFQHWSEDRRNERVGLLQSVIHDHVLARVSCVVKLEAMKRVLADTPFGQKGAVHNPYYYAFSMIMSEMARNRQQVGIHEKVDFIFDRQVMEEEKARTAWGIVERNPSPDTAGLLGSPPIFRDDRDFLPLQAADFAAWWRRRRWEEDLLVLSPLDWLRPTQKEIKSLEFVIDEGVIRKIIEAMIQRFASGEWRE